MFQYGRIWNSEKQMAVLIHFPNISADYSSGLIHNGLPAIEWPKEESELHEEDDLLLEATPKSTINMSISTYLLRITSQIFSEMDMFLFV